MILLNCKKCNVAYYQQSAILSHGQVVGQSGCCSSECFEGWKADLRAKVAEYRRTPRRYWKIAPAADYPAENTIVTDLQGLKDILTHEDKENEQETEQMVVTLITLTPEEFDLLPEFEGF